MCGRYHGEQSGDDEGWSGGGDGELESRVGAGGEGYVTYWL